MKLISPGIPGCFFLIVFFDLKRIVYSMYSIFQSPKSFTISIFFYENISY